MMSSIVPSHVARCSRIGGTGASSWRSPRVRFDADGCRRMELWTSRNGLTQQHHADLDGCGARCTCVAIRGDRESRRLFLKLAPTLGKKLDWTIPVTRTTGMMPGLLVGIQAGLAGLLPSSRLGSSIEAPFPPRIGELGGSTEPRVQVSAAERASLSGTKKKRIC